MPFNESLSHFKVGFALFIFSVIDAMFTDNNWESS